LVSGWAVRGQGGMGTRGRVAWSCPRGEQMRTEGTLVHERTGAAGGLRMDHMHPSA
jgi:hypothetical protein